MQKIDDDGADAPEDHLSDRDERLLARVQSIEMQIFAAMAEADTIREQILRRMDARLDRIGEEIVMTRRIVSGMFGIAMLTGFAILALIYR